MKLDCLDHLVLENPRVALVAFEGRDRSFGATALTSSESFELLPLLGCVLCEMFYAEVKEAPAGALLDRKIKKIFSSGKGSLGDIAALLVSYREANKIMESAGEQNG